MRKSQAQAPSGVSKSKVLPNFSQASRFGDRHPSGDVLGCLEHRFYFRHSTMPSTQQRKPSLKKRSAAHILAATARSLAGTVDKLIDYLTTGGTLPPSSHTTATPRTRRSSRRALESSAPSVPSLSQPLSGREREIALLLIEGLSNKEVAAKFVISPATVGAHAKSIYKKLRVHSRLELRARRADIERGHGTLR